MCGMSAAFSALFGTPVAAAVFSLELAAVGNLSPNWLVSAGIARMNTKITEWSTRIIHFWATADVQCTRWYVALTVNIVTIATT